MIFLPLGQLVVDADAVDLPGEHQSLVVRRVSGEEVRDASIHNRHGEVIRRMSGSRHSAVLIRTRAGLDGVDGQAFLAIDPTTSGRSK